MKSPSYTLNVTLHTHHEELLTRVPAHAGGPGPEITVKYRSLRSLEIIVHNQLSKTGTRF
jgi:hypothetical protein